MDAFLVQRMFDLLVWKYSTSHPSIPLNILPSRPTFHVLATSHVTFGFGMVPGMMKLTSLSSIFMLYPVKAVYSYVVRYWNGSMLSFPCSPYEALSFRFVSQGALFFTNGSSEILHPSETPGKIPHRLSFGKFSDPSKRMMA